jgi:hypothetical protein
VVISALVGAAGEAGTTATEVVVASLRIVETSDPISSISALRSSEFEPPQATTTRDIEITKPTTPRFIVLT